MWTLRIVRSSHHPTDLLLNNSVCSRCFAARSSIVSRDRVHRSSGWFTRYLQRDPSIDTCVNLNVAVRKNRYVILPVDFEEAWKVGCLVMLFMSFCLLNFPRSKLSKEETTLTNFVRCSSSSFISVSYFYPFRSVDLFRLGEMNCLLKNFHHLILVLHSCILCTCTLYIDFDLFLRDPIRSFTLASFWITQMDWRSFKGARTNNRLLITTVWYPCICLCLKRRERQALELETSLRRMQVTARWALLSILLVFISRLSNTSPVYLRLAQLNSALRVNVLLNTLDSVLNPHACSHFTEAREIMSVLRDGTIFSFVSLSSTERRRFAGDNFLCFCDCHGRTFVSISTNV